ncbi:MAG: cbb3-type cytochrome c oxidase subunit I [Deltaproteobacteria bacterium]|nr:cbb3-type cytochrome c oxidase subunit I [Deltaproteobacteria bacterium]
MLVLVLAGGFALAVVIGRTPPFDRWVTDPLFFKRCLAAHVNLALVAWFYSYLVALLFLLPGRAVAPTLARTATLTAGAGVALMLGGAWLPGAQPVLANYIPTIDSLPFQAGQVLFLAGVLLGIAERTLPFLSRPGAGGVSADAAPIAEIPPAAATGLRVAALAFGLAALTFGIAWLRMPPGLGNDVYYELLVWGGGHVLQLVCVLAMLSLWVILLEQVLGESPISRTAARLLFLSMTLPWAISPLLALAGPSTSAYREGFTQLMRWCLAPGVVAMLLICASPIQRAWRTRRIGLRTFADYRLSAFAVSALLTLLGFGLGAAIRGSNTMVPAHYHASGAVTVAFMAGTFWLLGVFRLPIPTRRLRRAAAWQPALYGTGMLVFAAGFALAGAHGMGRKVYGAEQASRGVAESVGLGMMGAGGAVSIAGGLLFLAIVATAWWRRAGAPVTPEAGLEESPGRWRLES